jgi:hypothetical protein
MAAAAGGGRRAAKDRPRRRTLVASPAMDALEALSDLVDVSPGLEAAVAFRMGAPLAGSTLADDQRSQRVADAALRLLDGASALRNGPRADEVVAVTREGALAVARCGELVVAAVTEPDPPVRLALHDVAACVRGLVGEGADAPR